MKETVCMLVKENERNNIDRSLLSWKQTEYELFVEWQRHKMMICKVIKFGV